MHNRFGLRFPVSADAYNAVMGGQTNHIAAVERLPEEAMLVLQEVCWEEYERLLEELWDRPGVRVTYDHGRLEIMSPSRRHEKYKSLVERMVFISAEELRMKLESSGSTTSKKKELLRGTEPDASFHIANAARVAGKEELDLNTDPPPDLVVEIDVTNESRSKFPIYAEFAVPEIWRYVVKQNIMYMYELSSGSYIEMKASRAFPILTCDVLEEFLERSKSDEEMQILADFRRWLRRVK
jgi:Uma2 family endonuclease